MPSYPVPQELRLEAKVAAHLLGLAGEQEVELVHLEVAAGFDNIASVAAVGTVVVVLATLVEEAVEAFVQPIDSPRRCAVQSSICICPCLSCSSTQGLAPSVLCLASSRIAERCHRASKLVVIVQVRRRARHSMPKIGTLHQISWVPAAVAVREAVQRLIFSMEVQMTSSAEQPVIRVRLVWVPWWMGVIASVSWAQVSLLLWAVGLAHAFRHWSILPFLRQYYRVVSLIFSR